MPTGPLPDDHLDSVTHLEAAHRGAVVHAASHGGLYAAAYAAGKGVAAIILNDAGIGREQAGIAGLELLADPRRAGGNGLAYLSADRGRASRRGARHAFDRERAGGRTRAGAGHGVSCRARPAGRGAAGPLAAATQGG